jgi:hypothetical protein
LRYRKGLHNVSISIQKFPQRIRLNHLLEGSLPLLVCCQIALTAAALPPLETDHASNLTGGKSLDATDTIKDQWIGTRPRILMTPERVERLRRLIDQKNAVQVAWRDLLANADRLLKEEFIAKSFAEGGSGQHGNYGRPSSQAVQMASTLSLAFHVTGNSKYAHKLKQMLFHYSSLARWAGDAHHDPPWHSELNTARFCYAYAIGYDSLHAYLSEQERQQVREAMIRLGILPTLNDWILPRQRIHALDSMGHNWWSVCVSMAGLAALSLLGDDARATAWVARIDRAFPEWFYYSGNVLQNKSPNFDRAGAFYESVSYANYALSEYLLFQLAWRDTFPKINPTPIPLIENTGDFFVHTSYPSSSGLLSVNFGDSKLRSTGARTVQLLLANGYDSSSYRWYLNQCELTVEDPLQLLLGEVFSEHVGQHPANTAVCYNDIGWSVLRSSWKKDATLLAVKSGFTWNHAHPDAGSFLLFQAGSPAIIDSGRCSYSRPEYTRYFRQSVAHNVVLFNGEAQNPEACARGDRGVVTPGSIPRMIDAAGIKYVFADATGPTAWKFSRNYRHFLWLDGVILVIDDVRAHETGLFEWLLHYEGQATVEDRRIRLVNGASCRVDVLSLYPENVDMIEKSGLKDGDPDAATPFLALQYPQETQHCKFITAIIPRDDDSEAAPSVSCQQGDDAIHVQIERAGQMTDVYLNLRADGRKMHRNSCHIIDGWETDAYLFATTRPVDADSSDPTAITRYFVACGSYLRKGEFVAVDSLSKVFLAFTNGQPVMQVGLEGQPIMNVSMCSRDEPESVIVNGQTIPVHYDHSRRSITLSSHLNSDSM